MNIEITRQSFCPSKIKVLLVGESPPVGGTFFYHGNSNLARYTQEGFAAAYGLDLSDSEEFLQWFKTNGFFLVDLCMTPVNGLDDQLRKTMCKNAIADLAARLAHMKPKAVISVKLSIVRQVRQALATAGMANTPFYSLPFPAMSHQRRYTAGLAEALIQLQEIGIMSAQGL